jgi:hypothetical protein
MIPIGCYAMLGQIAKELPKKKLESKLQEGKQRVKTSGMHSMYSNYNFFADYIKVFGIFLKRKNNFTYLVNVIESYNSLNHFKVKRLS